MPRARAGRCSTEQLVRAAGRLLCACAAAATCRRAHTCQESGWCCPTGPQALPVVAALGSPRCVELRAGGGSRSYYSAGFAANTLAECVPALLCLLKANGKQTSSVTLDVFSQTGGAAKRPKANPLELWSHGSTPSWDTRLVPARARQVGRRLLRRLVCCGWSESWGGPCAPRCCHASTNLGRVAMRGGYTTLRLRSALP
jgi:hypothetical protein